jgi:hypothetical protein
VSSRLARDAQGRPVGVDDQGRRYRVIGDQVAAGGTAISFMSAAAKTGRRVKPLVAELEPGPDGWVVGDKT